MNTQGAFISYTIGGKTCSANAVTLDGEPITLESPSANIFEALIQASGGRLRLGFNLSNRELGQRIRRIREEYGIVIKRVKQT